MVRRDGQELGNVNKVLEDSQRYTLRELRR